MTSVLDFDVVVFLVVLNVVVRAGLGLELTHWVHFPIYLAHFVGSVIVASDHNGTHKFLVYSKFVTGILQFK